MVQEISFQKTLSGYLDVHFSDDESLFFISYNAQTYVVPRPVIVPWAFTPTGTIYWMSMNGNDTNAGTQSAPFATCQHFLNIAKPGDLLYVLPGIYDEAPYAGYTAGTQGNPITISCAPVAAGGGLGTVMFRLPRNNSVNGNPYINSNNYNTSVFTLHACAYITLNGLVLRGCVDQPWAPPLIAYGNLSNPQGNPNGVMFENGVCTGCIVQNCVGIFNLHCGFKDQSGGTSGVQLLGNISAWNGRTSLDHGIYMPGNAVTIDGHISLYNTGYGIHHYSAPNLGKITRCVSIGDVIGGFAEYGTNSTWANCTVYGHTDNQYHRAMMMGGSAKGNTLNNMLFWHSYYGIDFSASLGNTFDYSDSCQFSYVNNPANIVTAGQPGSHCLNFPAPPYSKWTFPAGVDPLFVNAPLGDLRLLPGSPCIGTGTNVGFGTNIGAY